jgi:hypothetical protein
MIEAGSVKAARARVAEVLDGAPYVDLSRLIVGRAAQETEAARDVAEDAARTSGRSAVLHEARQAATDWVLQTFARRGYTGTWAATDVSMSVARPADRVEVADALADAVTAAVVDDLVDADTLDALRSRWDLLAASSSIPEPGALNDFSAGLTTRPNRRSGTSSLVLAILIVFGGLVGFGVIGSGSGFILALGLIALISAIWRRVTS